MAKKSTKGDAPKESKAPKADKGKDEAAAKKPRKRKAEAGTRALQAPRSVLALHSALPCPLCCIYTYPLCSPLAGPCVRTIRF